MARTAPRPQADSSGVVTRATLRAAELLGMGQRELAAVVGVSASSLSRLGRSRTIEIESKEGELALLFLRLYRSLDSLVGGDVAAARAWFRAENDHLGGAPAELVGRVEGLVRVVEYLDALRGRT
ncbi:MAG: DUF2384 domain-containing protein [Polyangiaceae bacterium]|nr:DUF2384 domain-containing protein [Polyangiaceae bacterium]